MDILQWRPGLLPRLTLSYSFHLFFGGHPAIEAGTIAPADSSSSEV